MTRRTLRLSARGVEDIEGRLAYTHRQFGDQKRIEYRELIREALEEIASDPQRPPAKQRPELHRDARTYHISRPGKRARHLFVYRVVDDLFVDIGRLLHDSMELQRHLPEGFES